MADICFQTAFAPSPKFALASSFHGVNANVAGKSTCKHVFRRPMKIFCASRKKSEGKNEGQSAKRPGRFARTSPSEAPGSSKPSSPFAGLAAGPGAQQPAFKGLSKPRKASKTGTSTSKFEDNTNSKSSSVEKVSETSPAQVDGPVKRAPRGVLGSSQRVAPVEIDTSKTAADFIAEGVTDDIDDALEQYDEQDIRFGVEDEQDPFAVPQDDSEDTEQVEEESLVGKSFDLAGDGAVTKTVLKEGSGDVIKAGAKVKVDYEGKLADGTVFDSSANRKEGFSFVVGEGQVIKGWEAGVGSMCKGEKAEFKIAPSYAYGRRGMPPVIPPSATLTFQIEVLDVEGGEEDSMDDDIASAMRDSRSSAPRDIVDISMDYEKRMATLKERRAKMSFLDRFYIISPFASQTGERPPWYLNPNITFFIVFFAVAASFYLVLKSGGLHYGYVKDAAETDVLPL